MPLLIKKYLPRVIFATILASSLLLVINLVYKSQASSIISPLVDNQPASNSVFLFFDKKKDPKILNNKLAEIIGDKWTGYSIYVKSLNTDFIMGINENNVFEAASINKLPILAAVYYLAQKGSVDLDKIITLQASDIQDYGTGSIRYDPPGSTYTIRELAKLMMKKSDNTAAYILSRYVIGNKQMQEFVDSWKLLQTDMNKNTTSNTDVALLMEKMFRGKMVNQDLTNEMLSFLTNSDFEDRIPALLPKTATVYHKIGNTIGGIHDVGIVVDGKKQYYLGIFTTGISNEVEATQTAGLISKAVYDFLR